MEIIIGLVVCWVVALIVGCILGSKGILGDIANIIRFLLRTGIILAIIIAVVVGLWKIGVITWILRGIEEMLQGLFGGFF